VEELLIFLNVLEFHRRFHLQSGFLSLKGKLLIKYRPLFFIITSEEIGRFSQNLV
jgi:hypothetical protein